MLLHPAYTSVRTRVADDGRRSADRISLTSLPFFFEGANVEIPDGFATPVQDPKVSRKLLPMVLTEPKVDTHGI